MRILILLLLAVPVWGQGGAAMRAQRASIAKQRASIRTQRTGGRRVLVTATPVAPRMNCPAVETPDLHRMIELAARVNEVRPELVLEVARQESRFHSCAVSPKGAEGLMQLMPATQAALGVSNPFNPEESLMAGARLLSDLLARYHGSLPLALSAYNAGPGRVDRAEGIPAIAETQNYVAQILSRLTD